MAVQWARLTSKSRKKIFLVSLKVLLSEVPYQLGEKKHFYFIFLVNP